MTVAEALSNLVFAAITDIRDVKCSGNWMWAAKLPGEGKTLPEKKTKTSFFHFYFFENQVLLFTILV